MDDAIQTVREALTYLLTGKGTLPDPSGGDTITMAGQLVTVHVPPRVATELLELVDRVEAVMKAAREYAEEPGAASFASLVEALAALDPTEAPR